MRFKKGTAEPVLEKSERVIDPIDVEYRKALHRFPIPTIIFSVLCTAFQWASITTNFQWLKVRVLLLAGTRLIRVILNLVGGFHELEICHV